MTLSWIQKWFKPCEDTAPLKQEIACLKMHLAESRHKEKSTDTTFVFDEESIKTIKGDHLYSLLNTAFPKAELKLADDEYQYTSLYEVQRWASYDPTNLLPWRKTVLDCDKFALTDMADFRREQDYRMGNAAFGMIWGNTTEYGYHAWNICLAQLIDTDAPDPDLFFLEAQSDQIWNIQNKSIHNYQPDFIYI